MRPRRGSRLRGPRSLPYYTPPMCPRCALYTLRGIFLAGGIVTFRAIDRVFREASLLPRTCNHQLFPLFSLSLSLLSDSFSFLFNFLHLLFVDHKNGSRSVTIDARRVPHSLFFKLREIEGEGRMIAGIEIF